MNLNIKIKEDTNQIYVFLSGEIDAYTAPKLREAVLPLAEKTEPLIEVSLKEVEYMDSTGLGVFVGLLKAVRKHNGHLKLVDLSSRLQRLFSITGLSDIIDISPKSVGEHQ